MLSNDGEIEHILPSHLIKILAMNKALTPSLLVNQLFDSVEERIEE